MMGMHTENGIGYWIVTRRYPADLEEQGVVEAHAHVDWHVRTGL